MNADDKKLLRKFINERAERTRQAMARTKLRREAEIDRPLPITALSPTQVEALDTLNERLAELADAMNAVVATGLYPRHSTSQRFYYPNQVVADRPNFTALDGLDVGKGLRLFTPTSTIERLLQITKAEKDLLNRDYQAALATLDETVNDALLDLLSKDLPGIKEELDKLGKAFRETSRAFGTTDSDYGN